MSRWWSGLNKRRVFGSVDESVTLVRQLRTFRSLGGATGMDYFEGELLPALKELLENSSDSIEYALLQTLEDARARFLAFLDLAPQSTKEKQDIESGWSRESLRRSCSSNQRLCHLRKPPVIARDNAIQHECQTSGFLIVD